MIFAQVTALKLSTTNTGSGRNKNQIVAYIKISISTNL
jgi:hypothetical protein